MISTYFRQESEMGRTYHRTPFKSFTSLYSPEAKDGKPEGDEEKKRPFTQPDDL